MILSVKIILSFIDILRVCCILHLALSTCQSMGIMGNLLDGCVYDIVITGDLTMAQQDTLQIGIVFFQLPQL